MRKIMKIISSTLSIFSLGANLPEIPKQNEETKTEETKKDESEDDEEVCVQI